MPQPVNHLLGQGRKMNYVLSHTDATYSLNMEKEATTSRQSANQFLLLDSADRLPLGDPNTTASVVGSVLSVQLQPWNDFQMQKPQSLMEAFARRIAITEIRMPWFVPNVNSYNNIFTIVTKDSTETLTLYTFIIPIRFYTPDALVETIAAQLADSATYAASGNAFLDPITFTYEPITFQYSFNMSPVEGNYAVFNYNATEQANGASYQRFISQANFFNLIGFPFSYSFTQIFVGGGGAQSLTGYATETNYTEFVDITSSKAHEFTNLRDGNSGPTSTVSLCRFFICDNVSINESPLIGQQPVILHRQFRSPKQIRFNNEATISWLDIQVRDSWGNLVPLPPSVVPPWATSSNVLPGIYPDFQITILASED